VSHLGVGIFSHMIEGRDFFEIVLVRSKKGIFISEGVEPLHGFFIVISSSDQRNLYLHSVMWIVQLAEECHFKDEWLAAQNADELRDLVLTAWKKQKGY
ncbi:MAG: hypothetical protein R6U10_07500, partial [Thermoplasmatota archaeon]